MFGPLTVPEMVYCPPQLSPTVLKKSKSVETNRCWGSESVTALMVRRRAKTFGAIYTTVRVRQELIDLDLCINFSKSVALRIGKGHNKSCCNLAANGSTIQWVTEAKYLGIYIRSGVKVTCNF